MGIWVLYVLIYAVIKGMREGIKKKAMAKSTIAEVLFFYTLTAFLLQIPFARDIFALTPVQILLIFIKSFVIFVAWICAFHAIEKMPVSLYAVLDLTRMLFSVLLGVLILRETMGGRQILGMAVIVGGLLIAVVILNRGFDNKPVSPDALDFTLPYEERVKLSEKINKNKKTAKMLMNFFIPLAFVFSLDLLDLFFDIFDRIKEIFG